MKTSHLLKKSSVLTAFLFTLIASLICRASIAETLEDTLKSLSAQRGEPFYLVGAGLYDITGPAAEAGMMGFAEPEQKTEGIYMRLWSRAFIIGDSRKRAVFVSADLGMIFQSVKQGVINKISQDPELSEYYSDENVLLSATHTHSGPGGYSHYFMYNVTTSGFIGENYELIVDGIYQSIKKAHDNLTPGRILINQGDLYNASMNRSPLAYANNPAQERARYDSNVDTTMTLLRLQKYDGTDIGMINWFAVHPTSIGPTNTLIGGDNKGLASYFFEKDDGTTYTADSDFVAAFAQSNAGDVTPNLWGPADGIHDYERGNIIAGRQYDKARSLFDTAETALEGAVDFRHTYVDMSDNYVESVGSTTCPSAMGASFSAGSTEDNTVSLALFDEGVTVDSLDSIEDAQSTFLQSFLSGFLSIFWPTTLDESYVECHGQKPILIPTGVATFDGNPWTPQIVPFQILQIGQLKIVAAPAEVTTMAGRRLRKAVTRNESDVVVIAGLANTYTSYVTTPEEYAMQHYEGASTHFGPHTLAAYEQEFSMLADALERGSAVNPGPEPDDLSDFQLTLQTGVAFDDVPWFSRFGDVVEQPADAYSQGDTASVVFWGGHPKNDPLIGGSYMDVEQKVNGEWVTVLRDLDPATTYHWARDGVAYSKVTVTLDTAAVFPGTYRIRHRGHWKAFLTGAISSYEGVSDSFIVQ
ncbi:MAG: neutral/alkaline ceramidase [Exilibacterium sp.]